MSMCQAYGSQSDCAQTEKHDVGNLRRKLCQKIQPLVVQVFSLGVGEGRADIIFYFLVCLAPLIDVSENRF